MIFALPSLFLLTMLQRLLAPRTSSSTDNVQELNKPDAEVIPFPKPVPK
ncbi:MAG: hypothetical protein NUV56_02385 [Candidatus Uhrbacteria bacterium]|nr:hypothetical protein [Candidatus Uhrbacteria bacterium]